MSDALFGAAIALNGGQPRCEVRHQRTEVTSSATFSYTEKLYVCMCRTIRNYENVTRNVLIRGPKAFSTNCK